MKINHVRIAAVILAVIIIAAGQFNYVWYIAVMHVSLEILNRQRIYLQHPYRMYNFIFWSYELVLLERLRAFFFSVQTEWLLNCLEHIFFGIIICLKIYIYPAVFFNKKVLSRWTRALIAFFAFNIIGVLNEVFQNSLTKRDLFVFIPDSIKDIKMNLEGAIIFTAAVLCRIWWLKKN